jgi:hypothetical protein
MQDQHTSNGRRAGLETPTRNRYFYGQLLGVHNFELETEYAIQLRRLLNRLVSGCGVVCGLGVELNDAGNKLAIAPGLAIDGWGRETVVAQKSGWIPIPGDVVAAAVERAGDCRDDACVQVVLCYHECLSDPTAVLAGDCGTVEPCAPSTIREQYRIELRSECAPRYDPACRIPNPFGGGRLDYEQLAKWVTYERRCSRLPGDPCIPLANLAITDFDSTPRCDPGGIDVTVRPILPSNVLLFELILALLGRERQESYYE